MVGDLKPCDSSSTFSVWELVASWSLSGVGGEGVRVVDDDARSGFEAHGILCFKICFPRSSERTRYIRVAVGIKMSFRGMLALMILEEVVLFHTVDLCAHAPLKYYTYDLLVSAGSCQPHSLLMTCDDME